jgi:hypothetical protein
VCEGILVRIKFVKYKQIDLTDEENEGRIDPLNGSS